MSIMKCQMCGGTLEIEDNGGYAVCAYCGTRQALPTGNDTQTQSSNNIRNSQADALRIENERRKASEAKARANEAQAQAEQNRLKVEEQRLQRERIAEQNRIRKSKRSKERRENALKILLSIFVIIVVGVLTFTVIVPSIKYSGAVKDVEAKNYEEAYLTFKSLSNFKDSKDMAKDLIKEHPEVAQIGDIIYFGNYEQDNKTSNGKEEIEWRVLDKDADGNMLVVSRYALDCRHYHNSPVKVTWETSDIRQWLNNDFISTTFTSAQRKNIKTVTLENKDNTDYNTDGGENTEDKVFLLSIDEAKAYLPSTVERVCMATKYAEAQGSQLESLTKSCRWWLRSPGSTLFTASFVKVDGFILQLGVPASVEKRSVRPAMWVEF